MSINSQNAKQIRDKMEVYCGLSARSTADLTFSIQGEKLKDTNYNVALDTESWDMRHLTDFAGEGFPLDGSCELLDTSIEGSLDDGKLGIRTPIGGSVTAQVTANKTIVAVTVAVTSGTGTITANGVSYQARRITVIPVNSTTITLTITSSDEEDRLEIGSITPGITMEFSNDNIVSVQLDLRSDLSIINPSWEISSIELQAYWPEDISTAISNIGDDVPIWYYAGYDGDYSDVRTFYMSEAASMKENLITLKGEDMSGKLEDAKNVAIQRLDSIAKSGRKTLYNWFVNIIKSAGIKPVSTQKAPTELGTVKTARSMVMTEASPRDYVQDIMNMAHVGAFWPLYVDAGIPKITWSKPTAKWDIYEEECGDVERKVDRNVAKIKTATDSEYGVINVATRAKKYSVLAKNIKIKAGKAIIKNLDSETWCWAYKVAYKRNNKFTWARLNTVKWTPNKTSVQKEVKTKEKYTSGKKKGQYKTVKKWFYRPTLYGKRLRISVSKRSVSASRPGYTAEVSPLALGAIYQGTTLLYPNYNRLFDVSNLGGSFTWKGDPRMQPRDVFRFHRLNGTVEECTIESIGITHEEGGTVAEISYRVGVI